jgi:hypothetical protein
MLGTRYHGMLMLGRIGRPGSSGVYGDNVDIVIVFGVQWYNMKSSVTLNRMR